MEGEVKRWGTSFAVRLSKRELDRLGIGEGDRVDVEIRKLPARGRGARRLSLEGLPTFEDPDPRASERHDEMLYGPRG